MKKLLKFTLATCLVSILATTPVLAMPQQPINLVIDGHNVQVDDVYEPFMMDRITYFPTDFLKSEFGVTTLERADGVTITTYDESNNKVEISLTTGSLDYTINGVKYKAEAAPVVISSRHCIPTRTIAPFFSMNFNYSDETNTLTLNKNCYDKRLYQK